MSFSPPKIHLLSICLLNKGKKSSFAFFSLFTILSFAFGCRVWRMKEDDRKRLRLNKIYKIYFFNCSKLSLDFCWGVKIKRSHDCKVESSLEENLHKTSRVLIFSRAFCYKLSKNQFEMMWTLLKDFFEAWRNLWKFPQSILIFFV